MSQPPTRATGSGRSNRGLLLPYLLPYVGYVGIATLARGRLSHEWDYALRIVFTAAWIAWAWRSWLPLRQPLDGAPSVGWAGSAVSLAIGGAAGVAGLWVWLALMRPFVPEAAAQGPAWTPLAWGLRTLAATLLVPLFEEQMMRGYVLRFALQWDRARAAGESDPFGVALDLRSIDDVRPGDWTVTAVALSTLIFALGHAQIEWAAAIAYGLEMAGLTVWRRDLLTAVTAHAVTNLGLAIYVYSTGQWAFW